MSQGSDLAATVNDLESEDLKKLNKHLQIGISESTPNSEVYFINLAASINGLTGTDRTDFSTGLTGGRDKHFPC